MVDEEGRDWETSGAKTCAGEDKVAGSVGGGWWAVRASRVGEDAMFVSVVGSMHWDKGRVDQYLRDTGDAVGTHRADRRASTMARSLHREKNCGCVNTIPTLFAH